VEAKDGSLPGVADGQRESRDQRRDERVGEKMRSNNQTLETTAAEHGIMTVTETRASSTSALPLPSGCASAER